MADAGLNSAIATAGAYIGGGIALGGGAAGAAIGDGLAVFQLVFMAHTIVPVLKGRRNQ